MVALCFHGRTLDVDSHAVGALEKNGARPGACAGGSFKPNEKLVIACFKGHDIDVAKTSANTKAKKNKLSKLGIKLGFCKA